MLTTFLPISHGTTTINLHLAQPRGQRKHSGQTTASAGGTQIALLWQDSNFHFFDAIFFTGTACAQVSSCRCFLRNLVWNNALSAPRQQIFTCLPRGLLSYIELLFSDISHATVHASATAFTSVACFFFCVFVSIYFLTTIPTCCLAFSASRLLTRLCNMFSNLFAPAQKLALRLWASAKHLAAGRFPLFLHDEAAPASPLWQSNSGNGRQFVISHTSGRKGTVLIPFL